MPGIPAIRRCRFLLRANTRRFVSPLTRTAQTLETLGARWLATYELPPMSVSQAEAWMVFLLQLDGRSGRFYGGDPSSTTPRGIATGTPTVSGGSQVGRFLATAGWTPNTTGILRAGDAVAWNTPSGWRELHRLTADANSGPSGTATLPLAPAIRESPADAASLIIASPTCVMRLATDEDGQWSVDEALVHSIVVSAEEAFAPSV